MHAEVDEEVVTPIPREVDGAGETRGIISNDEDGVWYGYQEGRDTHRMEKAMCCAG